MSSVDTFASIHPHKGKELTSDNGAPKHRFYCLQQGNHNPDCQLQKATV